MSKQMKPGHFDEAMTDPDEPDFAVDEWSFDEEFDDAADVSSLRTAWMGSNDRFD
jgi:hypothetical protein